VCAERGARLERSGRALVAGQDALELGARADVQLDKDLVQVILDRLRTDEQPREDLGGRGIFKKKTKK
jgi:hypothetical protein